MHEISIDDFGGRSVTSSPDELASIVARRHTHDANSFWISPVEAEYPCLAVMITGQLAYVHWFPAEGSAGHQSVGDGAASGQVLFVENDHGAEIALPRSTVVETDVALRGVWQFVDDFERPSAIGWVVL
jgi:hypothetical protein